MIKVTLEFMSIDQAIVALGKLVDGQPSRGVDSAALIKPDAGPSATSRKGRADKGKARGHLVKAATVTGEMPSTPALVEGGAPVAVPASPALPLFPAMTAADPPPLLRATIAADPASVVKAQIVAQQAANSVLPSKPAAAVVPTPDEAQSAMEKLFNAKGMETARAVLSRFGAKRVRDLKEDQRAQFIVDAEKVTAGGQA